MKCGELFFLPAAVLILILILKVIKSETHKDLKFLSSFEGSLPLKVKYSHPVYSIPIISVHPDSWFKIEISKTRWEFCTGVIASLHRRQKNFGEGVIKLERS